MDTIRLILPQLIGFLVFSGVAILAYVILKKQTTDKEALSFMRRIFAGIMIIISLVFLVWIINLLTVNDIPRSTIDRTGLNDQRQAFGSYTDSVLAARPKAVDTSKRINQNQIKQ